MALQASILEDSFQLITPRAEEFVHAFYGNLFLGHPEVVPLFEGADMEEQQKKLLAALTLTINSVRKLDVLVPVLQDLGAKHEGYGVRAEHYPIVGGILLQTLEQFLGDAWTDEVASAWTEAYAVIQSVMLEGAAGAQAA